MAFKTLVKFGLPTSFLYCTIYQQDVWREGDEKLIQEQKRVWRDFFNIVDHGYNTILMKLNLQQESTPSKTSSLVAKFDALDVKKCWNAKVQGAFVTIDQVVSDPKVIACKVYRKIQPYISNAKTD